jgi:hypothetical protein
MQQIGKVAAEDTELMRMTANVTVDTTDPASERQATR